MENRVAGRASQKEIAILAGVSEPTVSKVLRGRDGVSTATRHRVIEAAKKLGGSPPKFEPGGRSGHVVAAFRRLGEEYGGAVLQGVVAQANEFGWRVTVAVDPIGASNRDWDRWFNDQRACGAIGVLLVSTRVPDPLLLALEGAVVPVVALDPRGQTQVSCSTVGPSNWEGAVSAVEYLIEMGHRDLAFVGVDPTAGFAVERLSGFLSALELAGCPARREWLVEAPLSSEDPVAEGRTLGMSLAAWPRRPTAIVAATDALAFGLIDGLRIAGLRVPDDISVIGFDDVPSASRFSPRLTTVHQPLVQMGRLAVRVIHDQVTGTNCEASHLQLATTLVVRDSVVPRQRTLQS